MFDQYTPLMITQREMLNQVKNQNLLRKPKPKRSDPRKQDSIKYYKFHGDYRRNIDDNFKLKEETKNLIR